MAVIDASIIADQYRALGLDLPHQAAEALDLWAALGAPIDGTQTTDLRAEVADGTLTVENAADRLRTTALDLALRDGMRTLLRDLDGPTAARAMSAFYADADRVTGELREPYMAAVGEVVAALDHVRPEDFASPNRLLARGAHVTAAYHQAHAAAEVLEPIRRMVATLNPAVAPPVALFVELTAEAGPATLAAAQDAYGRGDPLRWLAMFATSGVVPALHVAAEAAQVSARSADLQRAHADATMGERVVALRKRERAWL